MWIFGKTIQPLDILKRLTHIINAGKGRGQKTREAILKRENFMDKILNRKGAATYIKMTERSVSRLMQFRLIPFIKTHFSKDPAHGRVFFSQKRLDEWMAKDEDLEAMTDLEKEAWKIERNANIVAERSKEADEELLALQILKLSRTLRSCLDEGKEPNLSEEERRKLEEHSGDFEEYFALIPQLHELEKKRLVEFFGDETCLFRFFPKTFATEIKAKDKAEAKAAKPRLERYDNVPPTKKPIEKNIQVVQEGSQQTKIFIEEEKE